MPDVLNPRHNRELERRTRAYQQASDDVLTSLMSRRNGRAWVCDFLERGHCFASSFSTDALQMAFFEGERNNVLKLLEDVMRVCPDFYVQMMRERNARELTNASRDERLDDGPADYGPGHPDYPTDEQLASYDTPIVEHGNGNGSSDTFGTE